MAAICGWEGNAKVEFEWKLGIESNCALKWLVVVNRMTDFGVW
jgi:hypothetical protein